MPIMIEEMSSTALVRTDYHSTVRGSKCTCCPDSELGHVSYVVQHDVLKDEPQDMHNVLKDLMKRAGVRDGDEFTLTVAKTGRRPFGNRKYRLVKPHTYEREV